jgi:receptor protein-tyrosine kinase
VTTFPDVDLVARAAARFSLEPRRLSSWPRIGPDGLREGGGRGCPPGNSFAGARKCSLDLSGMIDWEGARTPVMEEIRLIKRRLLKSVFEPQQRSELSRLVMITSPRPGDGKTFISCNLALSIALEEDYDVLLVDADITRQTARRNFGIEPTRGLVDLLLDPGLTLADAVLRTDIPRLSILPAGTISQRAPELLAGGRMRNLVATLTARHPDRVIIFDSAPCLVSSETPALAAHVGQILLVVEARKTQESEISAAVQLIGGCPDVSLVLNKARLGKSDAYGAYGAY